MNDCNEAYKNIFRQKGTLQRTVVGVSALTGEALVQIDAVVIQMLKNAP